jgi:hypothetical protein
MILLTTTSDIVRLISGSAGALDVFYSAMDVIGTTVVPVKPANLASISTATTTTIVAAPASSHQINVKHITIFNAHASVSNAITVEQYDGTTAESLWAGTLLAGEFVVLDELGVWTLYGVDGIAKTPTLKLDAKLRVVSDVVFATAATFADITGLTQALKGGRNYCFESHLYHISNATTTGAQFGVNIGAAPTTLRVSTIDTVTASVTASVHSAGTVTARDTAITAQTTGSAAETLAIISGFITPSADGTFAMRGTSEVSVASGLTIKAGSWLRIWETDN